VDGADAGGLEVGFQAKVEIRRSTPMKMSGRNSSRRFFN